jgi:uncharacterized protein (TIGR02246 family)
MSTETPEALSESFAAAIRAGDVPAALELWSEDAAILAADGSVVRGRTAIGAALEALVTGGVRVEVQLVRLFAAGDVALATGSLTLSGGSDEGGAYEQRSDSTVIYTRGADGRWRIAIDAPWGLPGAEKS